MQIPFINPFLNRWFSRKVFETLPAKDPMDWSLTPSSTEWQGEYYCPTCKVQTSHSEVMTDICNSCGSFDATLIFSKRVYRKIWNGTEWKYQYKYNNSSTGFTIVDKPYK